MIFRVNKTKGFSVMSNFHLLDKNLTLKAKGLLSLMLSLPDDWKFSVSGLASLTKEKESAIKSALDELKSCNYVIVTKLLPNQTESKKIEWLYDIYEQPVENQPIEVQGVEVQPIEVQSVENQGLQNTNIPNTKLQNTNNKERKKEVASPRAKEPTFDEILDSVPVIKENPELRKAFLEFIKMRKLIKAPLTNRALELAINDAFKFGKGQADQMQAVVEQSVKRSWRGIFEIKPEGSPEPVKNYQDYANPYTELRKKLENGGEL